ncbi:MAG: IMPACT family protein [Acidobacteriota bacterium]
MAPMTHAGTDVTWDAPAQAARMEIRVKASRFLADVAPVGRAQEAENHRKRLRAEFPHATHYCWAFRVHAEKGLISRSSDAGEPAGTAGAPILRALRSCGLAGVSVVVVRWFGGTKLGVGPLARAYRDAAEKALKAAGAETRCLGRLLRVRFPHGRSGEVRRALARHGALIREEHHGSEAELLVSAPLSRIPALRTSLDDASRGTASVQEGVTISERAGR